MSLPATTRAVEARLARRDAEVRAQRRSGNGTVADVAAFFKKSDRVVRQWKQDGVIGHTQVGENIWFSQDDVAEFGAKNHHAGKFSSSHPSELPDRIRRDWREFLGAVNDSEELRQRIALLEQKIFGTAAPTVRASGSPDLVDHVAVPFQPSTKAAA